MQDYICQLIKYVNTSSFVLYQKLPEETDHEEVENESYRNHVVEAVNPAEITKVENIKDCMNIKIKVNGDVLKKKRKKYKKRRLNIDDADDQLDSLSKPKKKSLTVKSLLEEKRVIESKITFF